MSDVINKKYDLSSLLKDEGKEFARLSLETLTTTGSGSFVSASSGTTYNFSSGTQDLYNQLAVVLDDYYISALDYNLIKNFIYGNGNPITDGIQTQLIRTNGVLTEVRLYQLDLTTLIIKTVLNRVGGVLNDVDTIVYADDGTTPILSYNDELVRTNGQLTAVTRTVSVS